MLQICLVLIKYMELYFILKWICPKQTAKLVYFHKTLKTPLVSKFHKLSNVMISEVLMSLNNCLHINTADY